MFLGDLDYSCTRNLQETMFEIVQAAIEIAYVFCRFFKGCSGLPGFDVLEPGTCTLRA